MLYNEAFGENTAIGYKVEFDGYKEEIIIYSEDAPKTYAFKIVCEGLVLNNANGTLTFIDEVNGNAVFTSDPLYIYDSSAQENGYIDTTYEVKKVDDYEYVMTIELNETFLQTAGLTYPIYIDPSIKYNDRDYIHDAPIYTARADEACGNHLVSYVGKYEDAYGVGRLLVRFPEMRESGSVFRNLDADEVISVKMYLYNSARGSYTTTIKAYQFLGTIGWDESTVTWNNAGANSLGDLQASVGISNTTSGYYAFDITDAAKLWVGNLRTADYRSQEGIIFLNANESDINYARNFRMSNFGASYSPYIVVNYTSILSEGIYNIQNVGTQKYMDVEGPSTNEGANIQQWTYHTGDQAKWYIKRQSDGYYTIQSVYSEKYVGVENNSTANNAAIKQYASNAGSGTRWGFSISSSGNYIITSKATGTNSRVLSVPLDYDANGTDLVQYTYSNDNNYKDEWMFKCVHVVSLNAFNQSASIVRNSFFTPVQNIVNGASNQCFYTVTTDYYEEHTVAEMINTLKNSTIFTVHTHGKQEGFLLKMGWLTHTWIEMDDLDGVDLSRMKFALLLTCNTGDGNYSYSRMNSGSAINIVEKLVERGVDNVIGFNDTTLVAECNNFAPDFYRLTISQGYSVEAAINYMKSSSVYDYEMLDAVVRGYLSESDPKVFLNQ